MDSISQIVLGAAVGEAVLGKKLGNRAMVWGGIAGTIPDLDVIASPFMTEVESLAFHRGISHSIVFAVFGALLFGWLVFRYYRRREEKPDVSLARWQWMFFLGLFTHTLLDCMTIYGTQLFAPFSDYRVAFSTISVADPLYTLPFMICLVIAAFHERTSPKRRRWNYIGLGWSCFYLLLTTVNKAYVREVFASQLDEQEIAYQRMILSPTILNNILWNATIEADSVFYEGKYSLLDKEDIRFDPIEKNHGLIEDGDEDPCLETLRWFTDGYYNIIRRNDGRLQFNDLRYGTFKRSGNGENDFVFRFVLAREGEEYIVEETKGGPEPGDEKEVMAELWTRIKGN